jgi:hypothetical protein
MCLISLLDLRFSPEILSARDETDDHDRQEFKENEVVASDSSQFSVGHYALRHWCTERITGPSVGM